METTIQTTFSCWEIQIIDTNLKSFFNSRSFFGQGASKFSETVQKLILDCHEKICFEKVFYPALYVIVPAALPSFCKSPVTTMSASGFFCFFLGDWMVWNGMDNLPIN